jgi:hypothetical protein
MIFREKTKWAVATGETEAKGSDMDYDDPASLSDCVLGRILNFQALNLMPCGRAY